MYLFELTQTSEHLPYSVTVMHEQMTSPVLVHTSMYQEFLIQLMVYQEFLILCYWYIHLQIRNMRKYITQGVNSFSPSSSRGLARPLRADQFQYV
jgi:hypothetical protein